jgi:phenylalanyl-tRNA synthetase alpha chain
MSDVNLYKMLSEMYSARAVAERYSAASVIKEYEQTLLSSHIQSILNQGASIGEQVSKAVNLPRPFYDANRLPSQAVSSLQDYERQVQRIAESVQIKAPDLQAIFGRALFEFGAAKELAALENVKAKYLGKTGALTEQLKGLAQLSPEDKKTRGSDVNRSKEATEAALKARREALASDVLAAQLDAESIDVTLPGRGRGTGGIHPVMKTWQRVEEIFASIGFDVADGPEIEADWFNFTALNNPPNHPARSMQDTFYVDMNGTDGLPLLLRTHTSPMQVRYAKMHAADTMAKGTPIKVIAPGRTYRVDSDATHSPMFHQVEGLWIAEDISFADLKGVYTDFLRRFFETDALQVRFRPSYFPFTEPSAEIDMKFESGPLKGKWLEISGSGQVHPSVVKNFGLDPEKYIGFAFGSGLERLTMLRYGIGDLRLFFEGDLRFLKQFA